MGPRPQTRRRLLGLHRRKRLNPGCRAGIADDAVVHCKTKAQAERVLAAITGRMGEVGLRLHPDKTRLVYCKDSNRRGDHEHTSFTFLGYEFRAREAKNRAGKIFSGFLPAMSRRRLLLNAG